jgi:hypothetical protein
MCSIFHSYIVHNPRGINIKEWLLSLASITIYINSILKIIQLGIKATAKSSFTLLFFFSGHLL